MPSCTCSCHQSGDLCMECCAGPPDNWRGKCVKIGRIVNKTYQSRKEMWLALCEIRTVLQQEEMGTDA